jgi:hypothetical protein
LTVRLSFNAEVQAADDLRSEGGAWFRATGSAMDPEGNAVVRSMMVDFKIRLRSVPERIETVAGARMASFAAGQPVDLMRIATDARDGSRRVTVVNFEQQRFGEFRVGADWFALVSENEVAGLLAQIFGLLTTGGGGERDIVPCDPSYALCYGNAVDACRNHGGVCDFHYSCDPQTGATVCSFTCCQIGQGQAPRDGGAADAGRIGSGARPAK